MTATAVVFPYMTMTRRRVLVVAAAAAGAGLPARTAHAETTTSPLLPTPGGGPVAIHAVRCAPAAPVTTIEVVDIFSGAVTKRVPAPGLHPLSYAQLRTTRHLGPAAYRAGL